MSLLRWIIGLTLPGLLLALLGVGALWFEYRTQYAAVRLGEYLLQHNRDRQTHGAVWQGILASRKSRSSLENPAPADPLKPETIPAALLRCLYDAERPAANFLILRARSRPQSLRLDQVSSREMQNLARSLQTYQQGNLLLANIELPRDTFRLQAQIQAQIALENGSIFQLLHRQMRKSNAPEAWDFVKMSGEDQGYWQDYLSRFFRPYSADEPEAFQDTTSAVASACATLLQTWADSLYAGELQRLQQTWTAGKDLQIRIVQNLDTFTGYAIVADDPPIRFTLTADRVAAVPGIRTLQEEKP